MCGQRPGPSTTNTLNPQIRLSQRFEGHKKSAGIASEGRILLDYRLSVRTKASVDSTSERVLDVELIVDGGASADQKATLNMKTEHVAR